MSNQWMSVSDIASARGVSKQAVSKRLAALGDRVPTRMDGIRKMVDAEAYDRVTGAETDPAQALRNRDVNPQAAQPAPLFKAADAPKRDVGSIAGQAFSVNRAKREGYDAELARIALEKEQGRLVPVDQVTDAMVTCAQKLVRLIDGLPGETEDPALRAILKRKAAELRAALYESMRLVADGSDDGDGA